MNPERLKKLTDAAKEAALGNAERRNDYADTLAMQHGKPLAGAMASSVTLCGFARKLLDMATVTGGMPDHVRKFLQAELHDISTDVLAWALVLRFGYDPAQEAASQGALSIVRKMLESELAACDLMLSGAKQLRKEN